MVKIIKKIRKQHIILGIVLIFAILLFMGKIPMLSLVTDTNYQGPHPLFYGIQWNGKTWDRDNPGAGNSFDTMMNWDPDQPYDGMGNLEGEETAMFLPGVQNPYGLPDWVPRQWISNLQYYKNPVKTYEWHVGNHYYKMAEYVLEWFVSIRYHPDGDQEKFASGWSAIADQCFIPRRYHNVKVWFQIRLQSPAYFSGANNTYFGIGKIELKNLEIIALDKGKVAVMPDSPGTPLPLYLSPFGQPYTPPEPYKFQGTELDPTVFTHSVYTYIRLDDFGEQRTLAIFNQLDKAMGDVVTFQFEVHVFVVGEWIVKNIDQVPKDYHARPVIADYWYLGKGWGEAIAGFFSNPLTIFWGSIITIIVILVVLAVFFPEVLFSIGNLLRSRRSK